MRRGWTLWLAIGLVVTACSGDGATPSTSSTSTVASTATTTPAATTTTTTQPDRGFRVSSEDGDLEIRVPVAAMAEDPGISIRLLTPEEYPAELAGAAENPGTRIYNLEPEGLTFDAPVRVFRRIPAENFGDLAATEVPIVFMLTQDAEGTFELFDTLEVMRDGDDVFVGGATTHFSPVISLYGQANAQIVPDSDHSVFATESGTNEFANIEFYGSDGTPLNKPDVIMPVIRDQEFFGGSRGENSRETVECTGIGEKTPRIGFQVTFLTDPEQGQVGVVGPQSLIPSLKSVDMELKVAQPFSCLDPKTSIIGLSFQMTIQNDHPGGAIDLPDRRGGLSAGWGHVTGRWVGGYMGLVKDSNGNGNVDLNDNIYEPQMVDSTGGFVLPLYSYGDYWVYTVDAESYSPLPSWGSSPYSVFDGLSWLCSLYEGDGRFETSVGLVGMPESPFQYTVDDSEEPKTYDGEVVRFSFDFRLFF